MNGPATGVTLAVLAGGAGSRMGGPKDRMTVGASGEPILERLLARLRWPGPTLLVSRSVPAPGSPRAPGFDYIVTDPVAGEGPVRGILTALDVATTEWTLAIPVDMPNLAREHLDWLLDRRDAHPSATGFLLARPGKYPGSREIEPFPSLFHRSNRAEVAAYLGRGERSVRGLASIAGILVVDAPEAWPADVWANLNTPEDLANWEASQHGRDQ
jgi:molybdopterin-guanine dinucleotide biosynthesis protein A